MLAVFGFSRVSCARILRRQSARLQVARAAMGRYRPKRTHVKNKTQSKARKTKYRSKDIDELQDAVLRGEQQREHDPDLPGMGQWTCLHCG
jgi:hypothetical protein